MRNGTDTLARHRLTAILISRFYFALDNLQAQEMMTTLPSARHTTLRFAVSARTVSITSYSVPGSPPLSSALAGRHVFGGQL